MIRYHRPRTSAGPFPNGSSHEYSTPVVKLTELSVGELVRRRLVIFAPLYLLKLRRRVGEAETHEERERLAGICREPEAALGEEAAGDRISEPEGNREILRGARGRKTPPQGSRPEYSQENREIMRFF